jgi:hypothetical protein
MAKNELFEKNIWGNAKELNNAAALKTPLDEEASKNIDEKTMQIGRDIIKKHIRAFKELAR